MTLPLMLRRVRNAVLTKFRSPTCLIGMPSKFSLGAVEPSPDRAIVPESIVILRGRALVL
jgi:hypothetical protein